MLKSFWFVWVLALLVAVLMSVCVLGIRMSDDVIFGTLIVLFVTTTGVVAMNHFLARHSAVGPLYGGVHVASLFLGLWLYAVYGGMWAGFLGGALVGLLHGALTIRSDEGQYIPEQTTLL